jgi:hypothetical protein
VKTVLFNLFNGFNIRYLLSSGIISELQNKNFRIYICSYNTIEVKKNFENLSNIFFFELDEKNDEIYKSKKLISFLDRVRYYIHGGKFQTPSLHFDVYKNDYLKSPSIIKYFKICILQGLIKILNFSKILRKIFLYFLESLYPNCYDQIFKNKIDLVVCTSQGTFKNDDLILRAAKKNNLKTLSIILSWDNSTTRGYPGCVTDYTIAWTKFMKKELIELSDLNEKRIKVLGSAQFDNYFKKTNIKKKQFFQNYNIKKNKKIIFFATRGPNTYSFNSEIIDLICKNIEERNLNNSILIVRVHPLHYSLKKKSQYNLLFEKYKILEKKYKNILRINYPNLISKNFDFNLNKKEVDVLHALIKYSDIIVNVFSTINLEAMIFDKPSLNVCFQYKKNKEKKNHRARHDIFVDLKQDHNQRILSTGGIINCLTDESLIDNIKFYLKKPKFNSKNRLKIYNREIGPNKGQVYRKISNFISNFVN